MERKQLAKQDYERSRVRVNIDEEDPVFQQSPAALLETRDVRLLRSIPEIIRNIELTPGEKGDTGATGPDGRDGKDGYTPVKGVDYFDGEQGPKGDKGDPASFGEMKGIANSSVTTHEGQFDHALIHSPETLGSLTLDEQSVAEGKFFQVKGGKIVCVDPPKPQVNMAPQIHGGGASSVRSFTVTSSRTLDAMGIYVIDATAGNITITLPTAEGKQNRWFELIRIDGSANTVTILPTGSETMSGMTDYVMQQWTTVKLFAYNLNYLLRSA